MAHGAPDYSNVRKEEFVYRVDDMGELSARINKPSSLERQGEVFYWQDFSDGFGGWVFNVYGTGAAYTLEPDTYQSRPFSVKLTGGSDGGRNALMTKYEPYIAPSVIGFEARVNHWPHIEWVRFGIDYYTATKQYTAQFIYKPLTMELKILNDSNATEVIKSSVKILDDELAFHYYKFVIDFANEKYVRALFNNHLIDISDYGVYYITSAVGEGLRFHIDVGCEAGWNQWGLVDNVIITRNEHT